MVIGITILTQDKQQLEKTLMKNDGPGVQIAKFIAVDLVGSNIKDGIKFASTELCKVYNEYSEIKKRK